MSELTNNTYGFYVWLAKIAGDVSFVVGIRIIHSGNYMFGIPCMAASACMLVVQLSFASLASNIYEMSKICKNYFGKEFVCLTREQFI